MSLGNFSLPYQSATPSPYVFTGSHGPQSTISNLRLNAVLPPPPAPSFNDDRRFQNEPYIPPAHYQQQQQQQQRQREHQLRAQDPYSGQQQQQQQHRGTVSSSSFSSSSQDTRYSNYNQDFRRTQPRQQQIPQQQIPLQQQIPQQQTPLQQQHQQHQQQQQIRTAPANPQQQQQPPRLPYPQDQDHVRDSGQQNGQNPGSRDEGPDNYPGRPGDGYTRVNGGANGSPGAKTSVHAILDYDDDDENENLEDYYDDENTEMPKDTRVTPIQGPIFLKNGSVPVVPLYSYPQLNNGTFVQIPILWTALSVALGVELRGDLVRGTPCIKRNHQLFCPTAGKTYPIERIEQFIDENKALMKRMYGDFETDENFGSSTSEPGTRRRRNAKKHDLPDGGPSLRDESHEHRRRSDPRVVEGGDSFFSKVRNTRQTFGTNRGNESGRVDACESKVEIVTPYWASNSAGKIRAIVNTQHFEQAIHQEVCSKTQTNRCTGDCGCEQKYKWHRLLAYDPDNDCKGIFMDWFLFPSCCVCRCDPMHRKFPATTTRN